MSDNIRLSVLYSAPLITPEGQPIDVLNFEKEKQALKHSFDDSGIAFEVFFGSANADNLREQINLGSQILHYSGHGHPDFLAFEGENGIAHPLDTDSLKNLIAAGGNSPLRLVFVSACHSRKAGEAFAEAGVKHVIAVKLETPVYDRAARVFAGQFYHALLRGKTVQEAFDIGASRVAADPDTILPEQEAEKFLLVPEYGNHDEVVFENAPGGVWQDVSPGLACHYLPAFPEDFVGRSRDMQQVLDAVNGRLTTLRGAPGIGKTALSKAVGYYLLERNIFRDGIYFIELRGAQSAEGVRFAVSEELGIKAENDRQLFQGIGDKNMLLILDNCEDPLHHDLTGFRKFVSGFLQRCRYVRLLLTSRQALGGGLAGVSERLVGVQQLGEKDAARLFSFKARAALGRWLTLGEIYSRDFEAILDILKGHPQAIALAAPQLETKSLSRLRCDLETKPVAALSVADIPEHDHDAASSFALSLSVSVDYLRERRPEAVCLFGVMGLLPGGALTGTLDAVWGEGWRELMNTLVRYSLIERNETGVGEYFFTFPFVTAYARELLNNADQVIFVKKVMEHCADLSKFIYDNLFGEQGETARFFLALLEPNLWACADTKLLENYPDLLGLQASLEKISFNFPHILLLTDRPEDGILISDIIIQSCRTAGTIKGEANTLQALGDLMMRVDDLESARQSYEKALPIFQEIKDRLGEANTLRAMGDLMMRVDDLESARQSYEKALPIYQEIKSRLGEANTLRALGDLMMRVSDLESARQSYEKALPIFQEIKDRLGEANTLKALGDLMMRVDDLESARQSYEKALPIYQEIKDRLGEANTLQSLGDLMSKLSDLESAKELYEKALPIYQEIKSRLGEANTLQEMGQLLRAEGNYDESNDRLMEATEIHLSISSFLSVGTDLLYLTRTKNNQGQYPVAVTISEVALSICRIIKDSWNQTLILEDQGDAFDGMENQTASIAAKWQAWQISQQIHPSMSQYFSSFFEKLEQEMEKEEYQNLIAKLEKEAETIRHKAVSEVINTHGNDPFVQKIGAMLPDDFTCCLDDV
ncbi:MAG: tetratricopeptide repeat protein [Desulfobacterales bacterium]|nr:tetratricopeptide repeat protein [Desulfobacterales bacterium]